MKNYSLTLLESINDTEAYIESNSTDVPQVKYQEYLNTK
jgi:hypothetical protein